MGRSRVGWLGLSVWTLLLRTWELPSEPLGVWWSRADWQPELCSKVAAHRWITATCGVTILITIFFADKYLYLFVQEVGRTGILLLWMVNPRVPGLTTQTQPVWGTSYMSSVVVKRELHQCQTLNFTSLTLVCVHFAIVWQSYFCSNILDTVCTLTITVLLVVFFICSQPKIFLLISVIFVGVLFCKFDLLCFMPCLFNTLIQSWNPSIAIASLWQLIGLTN